MSSSSSVSLGAIGRLVHPTDLVVALVLFAGGVFLWVTANNFDEVPALFAQNLSPALFPKLLLACVMGLAVILPFEHLFLQGGRERLDDGRKRPVQRRTYLIGAMTALLLAAMPYLGAIISLYAIAFVMPLLWGERRLKRLLPFAILFPSGVVVLFGILLKVHLDPGVYGVGLY